MQIGFDVGATKIESVVLEDSGEENFRERTDCPKDYNSVIKNISEITKSLEKKLNINHERRLPKKLLLS